MQLLNDRHINVWRLLSILTGHMLFAKHPSRLSLNFIENCGSCKDPEKKETVLNLLLVGFSLKMTRKFCQRESESKISGSINITTFLLYYQLVKTVQRLCPCHGSSRSSC